MNASVELGCQPCEISGSLGFEFNIVTRNFIPVNVQLKTAPNAIRAKASISLVVAYEEKDPRSPRITLASVPLPGGITVPGGIFKVGPVLNAEWGGELSGQIAAAIGTGAVATIPDSALLEIDLMHPSKNRFSSWMPTVEMEPVTFEVDQLRASVKVAQFIELYVDLGVAVLKKGISASVKAKIPNIEGKVEYIESNAPNVCPNDPKNDKAIKITNTYGAEVGFVAGTIGKNAVDVTLAAGSWPLLEPLCYGFGGSDPKPTTPAKAAKTTKKPLKTSPTPKPKPKGTNCKVGKSYGTGTCMRTKKCMDQNMVPVPGWCPNDPVDVQCCVEYPGANACEVKGEMGSCLSTTVCKAADGISTPGFCLNDPKGIQVRSRIVIHAGC